MMKRIFFVLALMAAGTALRAAATPSSVIRKTLPHILTHRPQPIQFSLTWTFITFPPFRARMPRERRVIPGIRS